MSKLGFGPSVVWWYISVIPTLRKQRQEDSNVEGQPELHSEDPVSKGSTEVEPEYPDFKALSFAFILEDSWTL